MLLNKETSARKRYTSRTANFFLKSKQFQAKIRACLRKVLRARNFILSSKKSREAIQMFYMWNIWINNSKSLLSCFIKRSRANLPFKIGGFFEHPVYSDDLNRAFRCSLIEWTSSVINLHLFSTLLS